MTPTGFVADLSAAGPPVASLAVIGVDPNGRTMWTHPIDPTALVVVGAGALLDIRPDARRRDVVDGDAAALIQSSGEGMPSSAKISASERPGTGDAAGTAGRL